MKEAFLNDGDYFMIPFGGVYILRSNPRRLRQGFFVLQTRRSKHRSFGKQKTHENSWVLILSGGD